MSLQARTLWPDGQQGRCANVTGFFCLNCVSVVALFPKWAPGGAQKGSPGRGRSRVRTGRVPFFYLLTEVIMFKEDVFLIVEE